MPTGAVRRTDYWPWLAASVSFQLLNIAIERWWPGSIAHTLVRIGFFGCLPIWIGLKFRAGVRRRRPHWTSESWLRYLRLAVMPIGALALVMYLSSFDMSKSTLGAPGSPTRRIVASVLLVMMILGVSGLMRAMDWIEQGEPSEQFRRTRWFQRLS